MIPEKSLRELIADEAARLIYEEGYRDYRLAKQKAAARLGAANQSQHQPGNDEIEQALHAYIRLLDPALQATLLAQHRAVALDAMEFLQNFRPMLVGAALEGTAGPHSAVTLLLSANRAEDVIFLLQDNNIPFQIHERRLRFGKKQAYYPLLRLYADEVEVELLVLPDEDRNAPLSAITGRSTRRADRKKLQELVQEQQSQHQLITE
ncbi:MAG TPA: hypothetical protein PLB10_02605 [Thiolinea sp.]|nr:hypothetical protein [Thiolinea sp.]